MARRHPRETRIEGIEQRRFSLPPRLFERDVKGRAHDESLELRLHDAVRTTRSGQSQLVTSLRAHHAPSVPLQRIRSLPAIVRYLEIKCAEISTVVEMSRAF